MPAAALLTLFLAAQPAPAREAPTLTREQVRTMSPEELTRRLFGDGALAGLVFAQRRFDSGRRPWIPLYSLTFLTRPRGTYRAGVCETDHLTVLFEPRPYSLGEDPPVRPRRIQVSTSYFVRDLALARAERVPDETERVTHDLACAEIDPRSAGIIVADGEMQVTRALALVGDLIAAAGAGRSTAPLLCRDGEGRPAAEAECLAMLARLHADKIGYVQLIERCAEQDPGLYCQRIETWEAGTDEGYVIQFELRRGNPAPVRIIVEPRRRDQSA
ncbi:MAG TPA: hypothetical protein VEX35_02780 [Allosphingosinicella sp.]|nr:hypothetical protein [Allosphingosinicella sp.]